MRSNSAPPRRLAVVTDAAYPWNTGGKEIRHHELLGRLAKRGFEVTVYTMKWWDGGRTTEVRGVRYVAICPRLSLYAGRRRSIWQALVFAACTLRMLTRRFDVVEVDAIPFLPLFPMRLVATLRRTPMIVTWHEYWGAAYWRNYLGLRGVLASAIENSAARLPTRIIAASQGTADRIRDSVRSAEVSVVPNGVSLLELERLNRSERAAATGGPTRLVVVGRLLHHKRVDVAVEAAALLLANGRQVSMLVVGEGPEKADLVRLAIDLGVSPFIDYIDFLPDRAELLNAIGEADVLLFPTVREGFGMVALEALSVGTPVVTSDVPDNFARHLVVPGSNGELCQPRGQEVASAVERILARHSDYAEAAIVSARGYDWDILADRVAEVYGR
jgi:glycosyltransferase involved in cell wall biosynthesis